jgi:sugar phosphate isomerase/epimerase
METSLCSWSFHRRLEAGQHDVFQYIADCQALGCTQLDLWNGHLPSLLDQDGRVGGRLPAELPAEPEPGAPPAPDWLLLPDEITYLDQVRAAADAAGLPTGCLAVDGAHIYEADTAARALNRLRATRWCQIAARLGAPQIRIDSGGPDDMPPDVFALIVAGYADLIGRAGQLGLRVIMENHWGASRVAANVVQILQAVPDLGLLFDSGNFPPGEHEAGWDLCARYATATHIKTRSFDELGNETAWDVPKVVRLLLEGGYDGCWGIESTPRDGDEFEAARKSLALIRRLVGQYSAQAPAEVA